MATNPYFRQVLLAYKRTEQQRSAHRNLDKQFLQVKQAAYKKSKTQLEKEIIKLRRQIQSVIEKEVYLVKSKRLGEQHSARMRKKLKDLEKKVVSAHQKNKELEERYKQDISRVIRRVESLYGKMIFVHAKHMKKISIEHNLRKKMDKVHTLDHLLLMEKQYQMLKEHYSALRGTVSSKEKRMLEEKMKRVEKKIIACKKKAGV